MTKRVPASVPRLAAGLALFLVGPALSVAWAAEPPAPPPPAAEAVQPPPVVAPPPPLVTPVAPLTASTDHDTIVGAWGVEVHQVAVLDRTLRQENGCEESCPVALNSLGVRHWSKNKYAWNVGLALALGGGSSRRAGVSYSWDTFVGAGPTVGASFLLANWKHLAVSAGPALDVVFFVPSGKGSKSVFFNLRGAIEGEVHLGMIGLPAASVGVDSGVAATFLYSSESKKDVPVDNATALKWGFAVNGPQSLWDLVTKAFVRYYF
jgi:hypothetical protein